MVSWLSEFHRITVTANGYIGTGYEYGTFGRHGDTVERPGEKYILLRRLCLCRNSFADTLRQRQCALRRIADVVTGVEASADGRRVEIV